ncbi:MAG: diguanylate cyclase [Polyangiaceae bacterium]|nr:diguanylate cyclase [Myxococcales bacterium]MCB9585322.1 diguanylate cyclase [Polyangiaceae bacterium]MCB9606661.1 diguanylate cyclase [Polyangiaceae bacterium]
MDLPRILIVDDDPGAIHILARLLSGIAALSVATTGADALRIAAETPPDLILLDAEMPGMNGFEVCAALKQEPALAHIPVIFVTSHKDEDFEVTGFDAGAADFIGKPINPRLVLVRVQNQLNVKRMGDQLRRNANTDGLTGLFNRAWLDHALTTEWRRARRSREPLSMLLIDVDHFKLYNDHYGHPAGDRCLQAVAEALQEVCRRPADTAARFGGEEFAVLLADTDERGAEVVAQKLLAAIASLGLEHGRSPTSPLVSVSVGMATWDPRPFGSLRPPDESDVEIAAFIERADRGLYAAKHAGRARACWAPETDEVKATGT